ncbi:GNAT family N-acetyltransferase [Hydrogenophaga laconesensis]|uniref:GNAT superfamily N-acetyltransferase n=1 Tax=Hydrogenophaga laconesensis TaxID=1805971 RepID=A0ABU1V9U9_9BURK|nr:GNAT family N-acetyltransferase [Hydrogenophaga laconesensis]MDR7094239.1 GNAT superfamily N-acetyltransferase [Hydrogenophaga laconesensis]
MSSAGDIEAIERATLQAVAPEVVESLPGWLLPMDSGTVGRARSAVPLHHGAPDLDLLEPLLARYVARGFVPSFRLPDLPAFEDFQRSLAQRGFVRAKPTLTQTTPVHALPAVDPDPDVALADAPDHAWMAMFLGPGLDPVDGASRAHSLARATGTRFASLREGGETVACGAASFSHGWLGVHGMRTAAAQRGRGLAARLLKAMAAEAARCGIEQVFLQVDASNAPALSLYRRLGFSTAWPYAYWQPADPGAV